jgi:hypothetical protein
MIAILKDTRRRPDGRLLRISEAVIPLQMENRASTKAKKQTEYLYDSQISVMVTGIDDWVWAGYCFVDVYFKDENHRERVEQIASARRDPHSCGRYPADPPIWTPREYFLRALSARMQQTKQEWDNSVSRLMQQIEPYVRNRFHYFDVLNTDTYPRSTLSPNKIQRSQRPENSV